MQIDTKVEYLRELCNWMSLQPCIYSMR